MQVLNRNLCFKVQGAALGSIQLKPQEPWLRDPFPAGTCPTPLQAPALPRGPTDTSFTQLLTQAPPSLDSKVLREPQASETPGDEGVMSHSEHQLLYVLHRVL